MGILLHANCLYYKNISADFQVNDKLTAGFQLTQAHIKDIYAKRVSVCGIRA
jgi:hypothetical protein